MFKKKKVAVIFGGKSHEHEVSRVSVYSVLKNLDKEKFDIKIIGITKQGMWLPYEGDIEKILTGEWEQVAMERAGYNKDQKEVKEAAFLFCPEVCKNLNADVVIPVLHGSNGEDGTIQGLFEIMGIPYVGCGVLASAVGMDKAYSKMVFEKVGLPQGKYMVVRQEELFSIKDIEKKVEEDIGYPCFVKPANAGSSVGISKVKESKYLKAALEEAFKIDKKVLIEEFIDGHELECAVLGNAKPIASVVGEIVPCNEFYDYKAKYIDEDSEIIIPAPIKLEIAEIIRKYAIKAFEALECSGLARVDFFLESGTNRVILNEVNTMPGFTNISMYPKLWEASGIGYSKLLESLINLAFERYENNKKELE